MTNSDLKKKPQESPHNNKSSFMLHLTIFYFFMFFCYLLEACFLLMGHRK